MEEAESWIQKRALVKLGENIAVFEVYFLEISPNRLYVKLECLGVPNEWRQLDGRKEWICVDDVNIVDFLPGVDLTGAMMRDAPRKLFD